MQFVKRSRAHIDDIEKMMMKINEMSSLFILI